MGGALYETLWTNGIKPQLGLPAAKMVVLVDWRAGFMNRCLQALTLLYLVVLLILEQEYLEYDVPKGEFFFSLNGTFMEAAQLAVVDDIRTGAVTMCAEPWMGMYNYSHSSDVAMNFTGCLTPVVDELASVEKEAILFRTTSTIDYIQKMSAPRFNASVEECAHMLQKDGQDCHEQWGIKSSQGSSYSYNYYTTTGDLDSSGNGTCVCQAQAQTLLAGVTDLQLEVEHSYNSLFGSGSHVKTHVRRAGSDVDLVVFNEGENLVGTVGEWVSWAGVGLDVQMNEEPNLQWLDPDFLTEQNVLQGPLGFKSGYFPFPRASGFNLQIRFEYYNFATAPGTRRDIFNFNAPTVCIVTVTPHFMWTAGPGISRFLINYPHEHKLRSFQSSNGISMVFKSGGAIYQFSYSILIKTLVNAIVMLGLSSAISIAYARYGMGMKSQFFNQIISEKLSVAKEYAQFAIKAIVASLFFDVFDEDGTGELSKRNIFAHLRRVTISQGVGVEQTGSLLEFMLKAADTGLDEENFNDEEISSEEEEEGVQENEGTKIRKPGWLRAIAKLCRRKKKKTEEQILSEEFDTAQNRGADIQEPHRTINREEWVNIFVGPPCTVDSCVKLINRKNYQQRYLLEKSNVKKFKHIHSQILDSYKHSIKLAEHGFNPRPKVSSGSIVKKAIRTSGRQQKEIGHLLKDVERMNKIAKRSAKEINQSEPKEDVVCSEDEAGPKHMCTQTEKKFLSSEKTQVNLKGKRKQKNNA